MGRYKIYIKFAKKGTMRFISHLDLQRLFVRAARRAGLPLFLSGGFSPHPKISFKRALKLGLESEDEEVSIIFRDYTASASAGERLGRQLPEGIDIKEVNENGSFAK